jgi:hypothetical protein
MRRFSIATVLSAGAVALALSPILAATAQAADSWDPEGYAECKAEHKGEGADSMAVCCITHGGTPVFGGLTCHDPAEVRAVGPTAPTSSKNPTVPPPANVPGKSGLG